MAKILAKIKRKHNGDELPDRRELVEMDLFDTDRNPWPGDISGGLWERHDYDIAVPYSPASDADTTSSPGEEIIGPVELVVERTSFAVTILGGVFDVTGGADGTKFVNLTLQVDSATVGNMISASTSRAPGSNASGYRTNTSEGVAYGVLNPGTYQVHLWAWTSDSSLAVSFTELAASVALLPAGLAALGMGWGGTGG